MHALTSEHAQYALCECLLVGMDWACPLRDVLCNGLDMPTEGCSVCMPIVIINF